MAGRGSRLKGLSVRLPKPLIPVLGKPMVEWALGTLDGCSIDRLIFVALEEHTAKYDLHDLLPSISPYPTEVVSIPSITDGQLCTVLRARSFMDWEEPLLIASADTYVVSNLQDDIDAMSPSSKGLISVTDLPGDRWSFVKTDEEGTVLDVAEKVRISPHASTGLYYFSSGRDFVRMGDALVRAGRRNRGEYYVIPLYKDYLKRGWRVDTSRASEMWDMGTPEALVHFEEHWKDKVESVKPG
ncbi:MAG: sugar phosphate nucleotidyltransferase [Rhodothermales bacterium]